MRTFYTKFMLKIYFHFALITTNAVFIGEVFILLF